MKDKKTVAQLRNELGYTQPQVARVLGITVGAYSRKENGKRPWFEIEMQKVADFFGVSIDQVDFVTPRLYYLESRRNRTA